ncbi:MAG TPA: hypothetical protein VLK28_11565 [Methylomirabilota bacterium]|nr:hypothetical protein [Methylomirabilota bacterium]
MPVVPEGLGAVTDSLYALGAGAPAAWLRGRPRFLAGERWISGGLYIGLGVAAALSRRRSTTEWARRGPTSARSARCR